MLLLPLVLSFALPRTRALVATRQWLRQLLRRELWPFHTLIVAEAMGWRSGLSENPWEAKSFYLLISLSVVVAAVGNFIHINPVKALFLSQVLAGVLTVPILIFILVLSNDRRVMRTANTRYQNFWIGAAIGGLLSTELLWVWWTLTRH